MKATDFLSAMPLPALLVDGTERISNANDEAQSLLGPQLIDRHYATILRQPLVIAAIETCRETRQTQKTRHISPDVVNDRVFEVNISYVRSDVGGTDGSVMVVFQDVSHIEQVGQMRRDFVANVSHELRTPLTALMGFIETLRGAAKDDPVAQKRFLDIMEGEATRMNRLIGDLLSLSRVESEERVRPTDRVIVNDVLRSTALSMRPLLQDASVDLELDIPDARISVNGDADQLQQVFTNLVENAVKYGGGGGVVKLSLATEPRDGVLRCPVAEVSVKDFGAGIDAVHLSRLTERFYRIDSHRSRQVGGTGLGLAIVKHIINRHRGRLKIKSVVGKGTTFGVVLPSN